MGCFQFHTVAIGLDGNRGNPAMESNRVLLNAHSADVRRNIGFPPNPKHWDHGVVTFRCRFFKEPGAVQDRLEPIIHRMLDKYACTVECLLLAWLFRHPAAIIPVVGTTRVDRIQAMAKAHKIELETEDWFALTEASWGYKVP